MFSKSALAKIQTQMLVCYFIQPCRCLALSAISDIQTCCYRRDGGESEQGELPYCIIPSNQAKLLRLAVNCWEN